MIRLTEGSLFENLSASTFYRSLLEFLKKTDIIKDADDYIDNFNPQLKARYAHTYPIAEIKQDIAEFIEEWLEDIKNMDGVRNVRNNRMSDKYGFSNYISLQFSRPADRRLYPYYEENSRLYNNVKFRFSEHSSKNDDSDIMDSVDFKRKTFQQAADEMKYKIENYIADLRSGEKRYLKNLDKANKKDKHRKYRG